MRYELQARESDRWTVWITTDDGSAHDAGEIHLENDGYNTYPPSSDTRATSRHITLEQAASAHYRWWEVEHETD